MDQVGPRPAIATAETVLKLGNGIAVRGWRSSDACSSSKHLNNVNVWNNLRNRIPHPYTEEHAQSWINFCQDKANHVKSGPWSPETGSQGPVVCPFFAITVNNEAVGGIGLEMKDDIYFRTGELGYWLGEEQWGKGIMSKVVPAVVDWCWRTFGILVRISAEVREDNVASRKLLEKAGFQYEGRRPDLICKNGILAAELMFGALRPR
ncbi:N-acetyltransferase [Teratosphaeria destructans]|uniref:N-acetyltransferase n=1 Tax=Teratosphaeria destructans TaxID=418781 RepID=A0A9W7SS76_9PEZI|nr:N-acetyltransferase [Teratosphaeria destructans]